MLPQDLDRLLTDAEEQELVRLLPTSPRQARAAGLEDNTGEFLKRLQIGRAVWEKLPCYIGWLDMRLRVNGDVVPCDTCRWVMGNVYRRGLRNRNSPAYRETFAASRRPSRHRRERAPCVCDFCCHAVTNARVDRFLKWSAPVTAALKGANQ